MQKSVSELLQLADAVLVDLGGIICHIEKI
jgi:hypothetical protein